jgi:sigma-B regulation protein RsbU (phosphoserine phosphatase)
MAKILLVEDNEQNRDMLSRRLQRNGHTVVTAADGERAVEMATAEAPDLVLMDLNLPVLDGWQATRRIKDAEATRRIPVIALTAHAMSGDRQKALGAGCDDYDTKPVELPRLLGKIQKLLDGKAAAALKVEVATPAVGSPAPTLPLPSAGEGRGEGGPAEVHSQSNAGRRTGLPPHPDPLPRTGEGAKTARILVVDDTPANRDMLSRRLERQGFEVQTAEDGEAALRLMSRAAPPFDLVLLDVMMPGLNGLDVLKAVRGRWDATELPVIMATARDASHDVVEALELGANDYVTKPLDFPVVMARVRTQLSLKRAVEQIRELEKGLEQRNAELQLANARMRADLDAASKVQAALLPVAAPEVPGYRVGWRFKPSAWLAGDILNVFRLDERHVGLYLLDVSGHGVAAALLSVTVSRFLSPARDPASLLWWREDDQDHYRLQPPAAVAARLGQRFPFDDKTGQYFTLVYGLLDLQTHRLRYVSAGHPGVIRVPRAGGGKLIEVTGYPIGVAGEAYDEHEVELSPGDRLFVYSDGVPEAMDAADTPFGSERLLAQLDESRGETLEGALDTLVRRIDRWRGGGHVHDDLSVLALERE